MEARIAGIVRGTGDWPLSHQQALWAELREPLGKTLRACSIESLQDWQSCVHFCAFNRDPRRIAWLVAVLEQADERAIKAIFGRLEEAAGRGALPEGADLAKLRKAYA